MRLLARVARRHARRRLVIVRIRLLFHLLDKVDRRDDALRVCNCCPVHQILPYRVALSGRARAVARAVPNEICHPHQPANRRKGMGGMTGRFSDKAWERTAGLRAAIAQMPFNRELEAGTLAPERFRFYITQDAL